MEDEREREGRRGSQGGKGQLSVSLFLFCVSDLWGLTLHSRTCGSHKGGDLEEVAGEVAPCVCVYASKWERFPLPG